ncbi:hypothetical protein BJX66DRAFT_99690 [Aspergillus keveii]|uniref:Uncharacterized protein n=1 Tax=Aspergillus keveii TaxID=714993 RepID=A0ABR4GP01_9EURO
MHRRKSTFGASRALQEHPCYISPFAESWSSLKISLSCLMTLTFCPVFSKRPIPFCAECTTQWARPKLVTGSMKCYTALSL